MTESDWLSCQDPQRMLVAIRDRASDRKLRLYAVAACHKLWQAVNDDRARNAVAVAERFADGCSTHVEMQAAWATLSPHHFSPPILSYGIELARHATVGQSLFAAMCVSQRVARREGVSRQTAAGLMCEVPILAAILRDIFGTLPFRPLQVEPDWLTWDGSAVVGLAQAIYDERAFDRLPFLADALEDAGCSNADILNHCRQPGEHHRGCWVVDAALGKQ